MAETATPTQDQTAVAKKPMTTKLHSTTAKPHAGKWSALSPKVQGAFKITPETDPQVLTFTSWAPNPWVLVGANGKNLFTLSGMNLTVIKAQTLAGAITISSLMTLDVVSDGWTAARPHEVVDIVSFELSFVGAAGGELLTFKPFLNIGCGSNGEQQFTELFSTDIFSLIGGAHFSLPATTFWPC